MFSRFVLHYIEHPCSCINLRIMARMQHCTCVIICSIFVIIALQYVNHQSLFASFVIKSGTWKSENIPKSLKTWLINTKAGKVKDNAEIRMFDKKTRSYESDIDYTIEDDDDNERSYKGGLTVGQFDGNDPHPNSILWQWRGGEIFHGFLYGKVDSSGTFTGDNIVFIYPDLLTGLQGRFRNGELEEAQAVKIVAHRLNNGVQELRFVKTKPKYVTWTRDVANDTYIGAHPLIMDPHERRSVYATTSEGGNGDGVFARRKFHSGDLVSYFNGIKTTEKKMFHDNMTDREVDHVGMYYFGLGGGAPRIYNVPKKIMLDIPDPYRSIKFYRTTLGHKVNHKFDVDTNVEFDFVEHPVFGVIVCHIATKDIEVDEELFVNYGYGLENLTGWFKDVYDDTYN